MGENVKHSNKKEVSFLNKLRKHLGRLTLLLNLLFLLWLYACCAITWIPCDEHPTISLVTISFPIAVLANILFVPAWLIVNYKRVWIPLLGMLLCVGYILDYYPLHFWNDKSGDGLKIVSWNMQGKYGVDSVKTYLQELDADIICLQESTSSDRQWGAFLDEMKGKGYELHCERGLALFTRLHIVQTDTLAYETRHNSSRWYMLESDGDTLILVNNHLESNGIPIEMKEEYVQVLDNPEYDKAKDSGRSILSLMRTSAFYRGNQTKALHRFIQEHKDKHIIVCGDFNDTPISYAYQTIARHLKNAYRDSGHGIGVSYNQKGFWVRIDHVFFSEDGTSNCTHIDRSMGISDHYPIVSWIKF